jgi:adenosylcobinamide-phosphate synthase
MLLSAARETVGLSDADVEGARESMLALAGRDASSLSPGELRSAAVESAAENLADGLVAPLFAFSLCAQGSLALGVAAAVWVKGVNTLDSMLGYRSKPVGWASARLDDAVMWLPARLSALLLGLAARAPGSLSHARAWASAPPSPNSGWPMATVAAVLDVELSKPGVYTLNRGAGLPDAETASRGVRVVGTAGGLSFLLAGVLVWF